MINFETMVRPALLKMLGFPNTDHQLIEVIAEDAMPEKKQMAFVCWTDLRLVNGQYRVRFNLNSEKGPLFSLANTNSLTIVPIDGEVKAGDRVQVMPLNW
jgi:molybdopterin molybdotransferase